MPVVAVSLTSLGLSSDTPLSASTVVLTGSTVTAASSTAVVRSRSPEVLIVTVAAVALPSGGVNSSVAPCSNFTCWFMFLQRAAEPLGEGDPATRGNASSPTASAYSAGTVTRNLAQLLSSRTPTP